MDRNRRQWVGSRLLPSGDHLRGAGRGDRVPRGSVLGTPRIEAWPFALRPATVECGVCYR